MFEAAAHLRAATHALALYHAPEDPPESEVDRLMEEAERLEVGLILFQDPSDFKTWDTMVEPARYDADPELLDEFVRTQLDNEARELLLKWAR